MKALGKVEKHLTAREAKFIKLHISKDLSVTDAYLAILSAGKVVTRESAAELGSRMLKRIKKKVAWEDLLDAVGLGDVRLAKELDARLKSEVTKFYQDEPLGEFEDNTTRMKATELLAELRGKKLTKVELSGKAVLVLKPEPMNIPDNAGVSE